MTRHSHDGSSTQSIQTPNRGAAGRNRSVSPNVRKGTAPSAQSQQRSRDRFISLLDEDGLTRSVVQEEDPDVLAELQAEDLKQALAEPIPNELRRITVFCIAETLDAKRLDTLIQGQAGGYTSQARMSLSHRGIHICPCDAYVFSDVVYMTTPRGATSGQGEVFFFSYGVVILWNFNEMQEEELLRSIARPCQTLPLPYHEVSIEQLEFVYSRTSPPEIHNDTISIPLRQATDHRTKMAISHALAQSSKLSVYEKRILSLVEEVRHMPQSMAKYGYVKMSRKQVAQLMGKVYLQKSAVNLLSHVLGTPDYFWRAPDWLQALYERACEYQELETRIQLVNARFEVIQKMVNIWRDHSNHAHLSHLDVIVVWLVLIECVLAFGECLTSQPP
ncbi:MAG: hypothetical protein WDW36_009743 [Sanguina aurantia]